MFLLLLLPALVFATCPLNWQEYNGQCYLYSPMISSWKAAEEICQTRGGHLASIHSKDQNDFILNHVITYPDFVTYMEVYIGGFWNRSANAWQWIDGSPMNYTNFDTPLKPLLPTEPIEEFRIFITGQWFTLEDTKGNYADGLVCQVPVCDSNGKSAPSILPPNSSGTALAYMANSDSWFYGCPRCLSQTYTQDVAENICQTLGAHLPAIHNAYQNAELMQAMTKISNQVGDNPNFALYCFGLISNSTGWDWHWMDGTTLDYTNWDKNEPEKFSHTAYSYVSTSSGLWSTGYIDSLQLSFNFGCQFKTNENLCQ